MNRPQQEGSLNQPRGEEQGQAEDPEDKKKTVSMSCLDESIALKKPHPPSSTAAVKLSRPEFVSQLWEVESFLRAASSKHRRHQLDGCEGNS